LRRAVKTLRGANYPPKIASILILGLFSIASPAFSQSCNTNIGRLFIWDDEALTKTLALLTAEPSAAISLRETQLNLAFEELLADAETVLALGPWSVRDKTKTPPSGDKGDYYSIGPYWWPDPKKEDGLPYIRRDGETNPERRTDAYDNVALSDMADAVETLALAGFLSNEAQYSERAALIVKTWFIDPKTAMHPNLNFAQSIPGRVDGRGIGLIDTYGLVKLVDAVGLLETQNLLSSEDMTVLRQWFEDFSLWMLRSENGKEERRALNNHGVFYDVQLAVFAAFSGDMTAIDKIIDGVESHRIPGQIDKRGRLPRELDRTRSFHYTAYTIKAFLDLAHIGECKERDLWRYETNKGAGIKKALTFHAGYADRLKSWPYRQIRTINPRGLFENLCRARARSDWTEPKLETAFQILSPQYPSSRLRLLTHNCSASEQITAQTK